MRADLLGFLVQKSASSSQMLSLLAGTDNPVEPYHGVCNWLIVSSQTQLPRLIKRMSYVWLALIGRVALTGVWSIPGGVPLGS